jgi:hypothetical protein
MIRRDFLKWSAGLSAGLVCGLPLLPSNPLAYAVATGPLYATPDLNAALVGQVTAGQPLPLSLAAQQAGWAQVPHGFIPLEWLRLFRWADHALPTEYPSPMAVSAPHAALRRWAASDAPLDVVLPHAALLEALRPFHAKPLWVEVQAQGQHGWIQSSHLHALDPLTPDPK